MNSLWLTNPPSVHFEQNKRVKKRKQYWGKTVFGFSKAALFTCHSKPEFESFAAGHVAALNLRLTVSRLQLLAQRLTKRTSRSCVVPLPRERSLDDRHLCLSFSAAGAYKFRTIKISLRRTRRRRRRRHRKRQHRRRGAPRPGLCVTYPSVP